MAIKICFITTTSITLKTFVVDTAMMLHEKMGMDITFVCDSDENMRASLPEYIHYYPITMKRGIDFSGLRSYKALVKFLRREAFDIVQYSTPNAALYASLAARKAKAPIRLYAQWGIRYVGFGGMKRRIFKLIETVTCSNSTTIRAVSPMNLDFAVSEHLYPRSKGKVLGIGGTIGVDLREYPLDKKGEWSDEIRSRLGIKDFYVFGFAGRLSRDKGGNELLKTMKRLSAQKDGIALLIVGPDETDGDINDELLAWAKNDKNIFFTGLVPKNEMPKYYAAMDALVHPTYREGFGMVLQEAAAMALPIITTRIPGASEVMEENISCLLAEPKSEDSLYKCMDSFFSNKEMSDEMGRQARIRVEQNFERQKMLGFQLADYKELLGIQKGK